MFNGLASLIPWPGARRSATGSVDMDLERGDESLPRMDDDRLSSISPFRVADSSASNIAEVNREEALLDPPQDELDTDNDLSTSGRGVGNSSEESVSAAVPGFLTTVGRPASTPPEILRVNPPPESILRQLRDQDYIYSAISSPSSAASNHSYARFFHRSRTPKRTRSTMSLGPGGIHGSLGILTPIYEPSNPDLRSLAATQKEEEVGGSLTPEKKTHAPSIHSTTSTVQERIMSMQATHPAFLKRSLKRSLSQTSSSSLHSEASGAPQLPPLHFRPAFTGLAMTILTSLTTPRPPTVVIPTKPSPSAMSPQRSQVSQSQSNTPQSLATPCSYRVGFMDHSHRYSAIYEDSVSEKSFVTASSGEAEPDPEVITNLDMPSTAQFIIYSQDEGQTEQEPDHVEEHAQDVQKRPSSSNVAVSVPGQPRTEQEMERNQSKRFSELESIFDAPPDPEKRPSSVPIPPQKPKGIGTASFMSIASTTVKNESVTADGAVEETATVVGDEQFITERWMKTLFYSSSGGKEHFSPAKGGERKEYPVSSTCVLFWVGFIAPWCWLVGGWMVSGDPSLRENKMKLKEKVSIDVDREMAPGGGGEGGLKKWILPDPSPSFKATIRTSPMSSAVTVPPKEAEEAGSTVVDPWVRRCRIASVVGGTILGLGLIVMAIVLAVVAG